MLKYVLRIWWTGLLLGTFLICLFFYLRSNGNDNFVNINVKTSLLILLVLTLFTAPFAFVLIMILPSVVRRANTFSEQRFRSAYTVLIAALLPSVALIWFSTGGYFGALHLTEALLSSLFFALPASASAWYFCPPRVAENAV
ncbi:MAG: hypothetical protein RL757_409 [Bacteroidota bacterium]|jgi:hypothetical protein